VAQATRWNGSAQRTAVGHRSATTSAIQSAPSADTCVISRARSAPRASKNERKVALSRPGAAHTSRFASWSTTMVRYRWPRLYEISSIPIRRNPCSGSRAVVASSATRVMIAPTVRHAIRSS